MEIRDLYKSVGTRRDFRLLTALMDHWRRGAGDKALPSYADLDPANLGPLFGHALLIDVSGAPVRFRVRRTGAMIDETLGRSYAGHWIDEPNAQYFERGNVADYVRTVMYKQPHFTCGQARSVSDRRINYMRLLLPLSSDGNAVDMLLGGVVASKASGACGSNEILPDTGTDQRSAIAS